jgi:O-antigen/teichoic acid export membrane protein
MVVVLTVAHFSGLLFSRTQKVVLFILMSGTIFTYGVSDIAIKTFEARKESGKVFLISISNKLTMFLAVLYIAWRHPSAIGLAVASLIGSVCFAGVGLWLLRNVPFSKPDKQLFKIYLGFALPVLLAALAGAVIDNSNHFIIGVFVDETEVGYFSVSTRLVRFLQWGSVSMMTLLFPTVSSLYDHGKGMKDVEQVIDRSFRYVNMIYWPIIFLVQIFGGVIITILFGEAFLPAISIFKMLVIYSLFISISRPVSALILGTGYPKFMAIAIVTTSITLLIFDLLFVPSEVMGIKMMGLGAKGAALATVLAYVINAIINHVIAYKVIGYRPPLKFFIYPFFCSLVVTVPFYVLGIGNMLLAYALPLRLLALAGSCVLFFGLYLGLLSLMGESVKDDLRLFWDSFNPKKMFSYIKGEAS